MRGIVFPFQLQSTEIQGWLKVRSDWVSPTWRILICSLFFLVERKGIRIRAVYGAQTWCYGFSVNKHSYNNYLASWIFKYMTLPYPILSLLWVEDLTILHSTSATRVGQYLVHVLVPNHYAHFGRNHNKNTQLSPAFQTCLAHVGSVVPKQIKNPFLVLILENILLRGFVGSSDPPYTSAWPWSIQSFLSSTFIVSHFKSPTSLKFRRYFSALIKCQPIDVFDT